MMDYTKLREQMVKEQLVGKGIRDQRVISAMQKVPRHLFVEEALGTQAYSDYPLPIGEGQTISQPYMVALMTEKLGLAGHERVLEVGTGSGYQTAVLAELARAVFSMERVPLLAAKAKSILQRLGYENVEIAEGDGSLGWPEKAPFDAILVTAGAPQIPQPLLDSLAEEGTLVIPVGTEFSQELYTIRKRNGKLIQTVSCPCVFVKLKGACGW